MLIRDARPDEVDEVARVLTAAYQEYAAVLPPARWEAYARHMADVRSRLPHSELIVAELDGGIVGTVTFYPDGSVAEGGGWPPGWSGLRLLGVLPEARGRGGRQPLHATQPGCGAPVRSGRFLRLS